MEIREYLAVLRRRAWIPALLVVVTVAATAVFVYLAKPQYQATATVIAKGSGQALSFQDVASSDNVAIKVNQQLNLPESYSDTAGRIQVTSGRTNLYRITVTDTNPRQAEQIANAAAQTSADLYYQFAIGALTPASADMQDTQTAALNRYLTAATNLVTFKHAHPQAASSTDPSLAAQAMELQLEVDAAAQAYLNLQSDLANAQVAQQTNSLAYQASVVDQAVAVPDTTGRYLKLLYAAVFALVLGVALIFGLEYMDNSIREPEEVEQLLGAPVIGVIPRVTPRALRPAMEKA